MVVVVDFASVIITVDNSFADDGDGDDDDDDDVDDDYDTEAVDRK